MKVVLTAGHGNGDPGAVGFGFTEADLMTELRDMVAQQLQAIGVTVVMDGGKRENKALNFALGLFGLAPIRVELHCNASTNPKAGGAEAISLPRDKWMAQLLANATAGVLGIAVRGDQGWIDQTRSARGRLAYVERGGIILETFFISNKKELDSYLANKDKLAETLAKVIAKRVTY